MPNGGTGDPTQELRERLASLHVDEEKQFLEYLALAARLAALSDRSALDRWTELALPYQSRVETLLTERATQGARDLDRAAGKDAALAIIDAQDFACFLQFECEILPPESGRMLRAWIERAEEMSLDEEAVQFLEAFIDQFPLNEAFRLTIVDSPMTVFETVVAAHLWQQQSVIQAIWQRGEEDEVSDVSTEICDLAMYDAGTPSDRLKRVFRRTQSPATVPQLGTILVTRRVGDEWQIIIDIEMPARGFPPIERVRLGDLPAERELAENLEEWIVRLRPFEHTQRLQLMEAPLCIALRDGCQIRFSEE
jgi:hypothetical protein